MTQINVESAQALRSIILFANGMVMAFDQNGRQVSEYQGMADQVYIKLQAVPLSEGVKYSAGVWRSGTTPLTRENFFSLLKSAASTQVT